MEESFVIDWSTLGELERDELVQLLKTADSELKRDTSLAIEHVTLDAVEKIASLCTKEDAEVAAAASDVVLAAFQKLSESDRELLLLGLRLEDGSETYLRLAVRLLALVSTNSSRLKLMRLLFHESVGLAAMEALRNFPPPTTAELNECIPACGKSILLSLRVLDLAAHFDETQVWAAERMRQIVNELKNDPLALVNVVELLSNLPKAILDHSIDDFRLMLDDPVVQTLDILLSYFVRLFAKYFSQCSDPLPGWFVELLFADKIPLELIFQTCGFLFHRRPLAEAQLRETTLRDLIHRNAKRDLIDVMVMNLVTTILEESMEEDAFSFWFPRDWGRHLIVGSNGPDKDVRSAAVQCISATGKYRKAIRYFQSVTDFANFRRGPGLLAHRSTACRRFAAHDEFAEVFGEELNNIWAEQVADSNIQDPEVAVESMQM